jgi:hypothetical protein
VATMSQTKPETVDDHNPFEGLTPTQETFLTRLANWVYAEYPDGPPIKLEISNGAAQDRLGLDIDAHEVMVLMTTDVRGGPLPRAVGVLIMNRVDAQAVVVGDYGAGASTSTYGDGSSPHQAPAVVDPCVSWAYVNGQLRCTGYGDGGG